MLLAASYCLSIRRFVEVQTELYHDPERGGKLLMTSWCFADNKISKIPALALAGLPNLEWLDLSKNKLGDFSLGLNVFQVRFSQENLISKCTLNISLCLLS